MTIHCPNCGAPFTPPAISPEALGLTPKQRECLDAIERLTRNNVPPSYKQLADALGLKSKSGIVRLVRALIERGYVQQKPKRRRTLTIVKPLEAAHAAAP